MTPAAVTIPAGLEAQRGLGPAWGSWLDALPRRSRDLCEEWALVLDGPAMHGFCSLVLPVVTDSGDRAVLKLTFDGDDESLHEGLALQHWRGGSTVRLLRADPRRRALLLERLSTQDLTARPALEACRIVAELYADLHVPALPQLRTVTSYVEGWLRDLAALRGVDVVPRRYVDQALALGADLVGDQAGTGCVVHGDLHYENVLRGSRGWVVIDPKPMSGDPHYEVAPLLWNRWAEMVESGDLRQALRQRFHTVVDVAGLDEDRARDWVVLRMILNAGWAAADLRDGSADVAETREWVTTCVTVAKAVQE